MTLKNRPKLRMAPPTTVLAEQQDAAARLLLLDKWTEEPNNPPPSGLAATIIVPERVEAAQEPPKPAAKPKLPAVPQKPWEGPNAAAPHPYHTVLSEGLFQKIDFVWKRQGYKSMKEWMIQHVEQSVDKALKGMGEL